jgi:hypothetical protein
MKIDNLFMPIKKDILVHHRKDILYLLLIIILSFVFFFYALGDYSLKEPDEGRYAEIPREMVESGDYIVPHLNYVRYFEKPPFFYWIVALSYKLFGISELSFRSANVFFAFLSVLFLYFFARKWFNRGIALLSSIILMSSIGFFLMSRVVTLDMCFSFLLFASLLCFYGFYRDRSSLLLYLSYMFMGFATLAKGPVAVILLSSTIIIFLMVFNIDTINRVNTTKDLAAAINQKKGAFDYLVSYDCYEQALPFYTKSRLILADHAGELKMGSKYEDAKGYFISEPEFMQLLMSRKKVLFIAEESKIRDVKKKIPIKLDKIKCQNDKCLFTNYR